MHLGLFGRFRHHDVPPPEPRGAVRLRLVGAEGAVDLSGPTACDLIGEEGRDAILARLGPDPLRDDADPERAIASLARRRLPIGAALLDQSIIAGVGNAYSDEVLHVAKLSPFALAATLDYVRTRQQFGAPIGSFQVVQHKVVDMSVACEEARALMMVAASQLASGGDASSLIAAAKVRVAQCGIAVAQQAVQLHGGVGTSEELIVSHHLRRQMMLDLAHGDRDHHKARFAELTR